jgi:putative PIN family toxin of toxin-antitoxin system
MDSEMPASIVANSAVVRVVLDTNVLISAALKPAGLEAAVVNAVIAGELEAWVTEEIWGEYEEVLARPKFNAVREVSHGILAALRSRVSITRPVAALAAALDKDDTRFIECAEAAQTDFIVTGNRRHYPAEFGRTRVVNARELLEAILK